MVEKPANQPNDKQKEPEEVNFAKTLDKEAFDVINRLYGNTFKELVDR